MSTAQETTEVVKTEQVSTEKVKDVSTFTEEVAPPTKTEEAKVETKTEGEKSKEKTDEKKDEVGTEAAKPAATEEDFKLSVTENSGLSEVDAEEVKSFAKENGLTKEAAQKLLDARASIISNVKIKEQENLKQQAKVWLEQTKSDKEVGGELFDSSISLAKNALDQFASPAFRKTLNDTGLGNHPEVVKIFARIGKKMSNDTLVAAPRGEAAKVKNDYEYFYGPDEA